MQQRGPRDSLGQVLDQVEQGRLRPVHVLEDRHHRTLRGGRFEQPAKADEDFLAAARALAFDQCLADGFGQASGLILGGEISPTASVRRSAAQRSREGARR